MTVYDFESEVMKKMVEEEIERYPSETRTPNDEVEAFVIASQKALKITSGEEAINFFCKSQRIYEDLHKMTQFPKSLFKSKVIIREWLDFVPCNPQSYFFFVFIYFNFLFYFIFIFF